MNTGRCHQGCGEPCRACETIADVAKNKGAFDAGDLVVLGHVMALLSTTKHRSPLGSLHLCPTHRSFADLAAKRTGLTLSIPAHRDSNVIVRAGLN